MNIKDLKEPWLEDWQVRKIMAELKPEPEKAVKRAKVIQTADPRYSVPPYAKPNE